MAKECHCEPVTQTCHCEQSEAISRLWGLLVGPSRAERGIAGHLVDRRDARRNMDSSQSRIHAPS